MQCFNECQIVFVIKRRLTLRYKMKTGSKTKIMGNGMCWLRPWNLDYVMLLIMLSAVLCIRKIRVNFTY